MFERLACRTRSGSVGVLGVSFLAASALTLPSAAQAQADAIYGGAGGHYFEYSCGPGRVLVGLRGSAGVLVDAIQPICARVDLRDLAIGSDLGPVFGSDRKMDTWAQCPVRYAVTDAYMARNEKDPYLGAIGLICTELVRRDGGGRETVEVRGTGHFEGYESRFGLIGGYEGSMTGSSHCPGGWAVGIRGRSDRYVDAFGLMCGPKPAGDPSAGHTLGKRKKQSPSAIGERTPGDPTMTSIPGLADQPRTLGKRKRPAPTGGAGSEPNPMAGQPAQTDQPLGASLNSDGGIPPAPPVVPAEPPSALINGTYATTVTVSDSRCLTQDLRGSWRGTAELNPQPAILIPLQNFGSLFAAPVVVQVQGLVVRQSTQIQMRAGPVGGPVPADFDGVFSNDGSQFNVRFTAGTQLCRIGGTISGTRN